MTDQQKRTTPEAPHTAAEAADQLNDLAKMLADARSHAKKLRNCRDKMEQLYRTAKSRALIDPTLDGKNQAERDANAHEWSLPGEVREEAARAAEAMGLEGTVPTTVGDLRWLRDRAEGLSEHWSATAYDRRHVLSGWLVVASMAKQEAEFGHVGQEAA